MNTIQFRKYLRKYIISPLTNLNYKFGFIKDNFLWESARYIYSHLIELRALEQLGQDEDAISFYSKNKERVSAIANVLADEKSKKIYLGMIRYRQSRRKKDFPLRTIPEAQYFIKELKFVKDEVFIDGGAFLGDTIDPFLRRCKKYKQIIAFEPDTQNFEKLKNKYKNNPKIILMNAGLYDKDGEISFNCEGSSGSRITENVEQKSNSKIQIKCIDGLGLERVSFIKMDIEGAELNALKGASKTILRDKPKLAICLYHSNEDMLNIAEYIHGLVPEYNLYVRHHGIGVIDTILYAIMP